MVSERELQVVVPVGFLLAEPQDVSVSVARPGGAPLPIRLRLVPALVSEAESAAPVPHPWPALIRAADLDDGYTGLGGGD